QERIEILRMNPLPDCFVIWKALVWIEPQDSKHFLGPVQRFTHTRLMSSTTGVSQPLCLCKVSLTAPYLLFRALTIFDIDSGSVPFHSVTMFISQRHRTYQEPAIGPLRVTMSRFIFERLAGSPGGTPFFQMLFAIVGVKCDFPTSA